MTAEAVLGIIGGLVVLVLGAVCGMLLSIRDRMLVLETTLGIHQKNGEELLELRAVKHWSVNVLPALMAVAEEHDQRLCALDKERPTSFKWPDINTYRKSAK